MKICEAADNPMSELEEQKV